MSVILMDSHVFYNFALGKPHIGPETIYLLRGASRLMISSMSIFELNIKHLLGQFEDIEPLVEAIKAAGVVEIPLTSAAVFRLKQFPQLAKHDPFDRALVAQAMELNAQFVTADRKLVNMGFDWIKDARR